MLSAPDRFSTLRSLTIPYLALLAAFVAGAPSDAQVMELFISEYVRGIEPRFNKAVEIYNGTESPVDLAAGDYRVVMYFNGNLIVGSNIALEGVVEPGEVWVLVRNRAEDPVLRAAADQFSNQNFFSGNDTVLLMKGGAVIDAFGQLGVDPGDQWPGNVSTDNVTLRRRPKICRGDVFVDDAFFASSGEWDELAVNTFDGLGQHAVEAGCQSCPTAAELTCGAGPVVVAGSNDDPGSTSIADRYSCLGSSYSGPEVVYLFEPPIDGRYRLELDDLAADLDLIVLGPGDCRPNLCAASSDASSIGSEELSFDARAGERYYVAVDGVSGAVSAYNLRLVCPAPARAAFTLLPEFPTAGAEVHLFDASEGDPTSWSWDFGDDATAAGKNPRHTYSDAGTYTLTLTVENASGSDVASRAIVVAPPATSVVLGGPETGRTGDSLTFTAAAQGCEPEDDGWQWLAAGAEVEGEATGARLTVRWSSPGSKLLTVANSACGEAAGALAVVIAPASAGGPPAAPSLLTAEPRSATEVLLRWTEPVAAEAFRVERRRQGGFFVPLVQVPGEKNEVEVSLAGALDPTRIPTSFRVFALNSRGSSPSSNEATVTTVPGSCDSGQALCLLDKRFELKATWRDFGGRSGTAHPVALTRDTGYFWFFAPGNVEVMVKVLDGRPFNGHFWVFFGALSNVEYTLEVSDTVTGNTKIYVNPSGQIASQGDTSALPGETMAGTGESRTIFADKADLPLARGLAPRAAVAVDFDWVPQVPSAGEEVLFDDRSDVMAPRVDRIWDFGDGSKPATTVNERQVRHRFDAPGNFEVTLYVMEPGDIAAQTATRRVQVASPVEASLSLDAPSSVVVEATATLSATAGDGCSPLRPRGWQWDVGDGGVTGAADRSSIDVVWKSPGRRTVTVRNSGCSSVSAEAVVEVTDEPTPRPSPCEPGDKVLCLANNRFRVEVDWRDFAGNTGRGFAQRITRETGDFWFFSPENVELVVKVLDGRCNNGHFWVFYGALSNVGFDLTVTDTATQGSKSYRNPPGKFASVADVQALPAECPRP